MYFSVEQFRPNIVLDTGISYSEDKLAELRVGPLLLRQSGPANRCNVIRMNLEKRCFVDEHEPYSTLGTYRTLPGCGVVFGNYY